MLKTNEDILEEKETPKEDLGEDLLDEELDEELPEEDLFNEGSFEDDEATPFMFNYGKRVVQMIPHSNPYGFLVPSMTTTQRNAMSSPLAGTLIYNSTTNKMNFYSGSGWEAITSV